MDWSKTLIGGAVAGLALAAMEFILHGQVMASTYMSYPDVFEQEQANPLHFVLVAVCMAVAAAILFGKTREAWADGARGGATFGCLLGVIAFFAAFYRPLVFEGFPYYLAWCQGAINLLTWTIVGVVLGLMIKKT